MFLAVHTPHTRTGENKFAKASN